MHSLIISITMHLHDRDSYALLEFVLPFLSTSAHLHNQTPSTTTSTINSIPELCPKPLLDQSICVDSPSITSGWPVVTPRPKVAPPQVIVNVLSTDLGLWKQKEDVVPVS